MTTTATGSSGIPSSLVRGGVAGGVGLRFWALVAHGFRLLGWQLAG